MVVRWAFVIVIHLDSEYMSNDYQTIQGCYDPSWHADGYCDDVNNNEACFFDGGDCCGGIIDENYCTECLCLEDGGGGSGGTTAPSEICNEGWIANGYCDDINNNLACTYDGGDCCGCNVQTQYCTECLCLEGGGGDSGGTITPCGSTATLGTTTTGYLMAK